MFECLKWLSCMLVDLLIDSFGPRHSLEFFRVCSLIYLNISERYFRTCKRMARSWLSTKPQRWLFEDWHYQVNWSGSLYWPICWDFCTWNYVVHANREHIQQLLLAFCQGTITVASYNQFIRSSRSGCKLWPVSCSQSSGLNRPVHVET